MRVDTLGTSDYYRGVRKKGKENLSFTLKIVVVAALVCSILLMTLFPYGIEVDNFQMIGTSLTYNSYQSQAVQRYYYEVANVEVGEISGGKEDPYIGTLADMIVKFAIDVALQYGSGYIPNNYDKSHVSVIDKSIIYGGNQHDLTYGYYPWDNAIANFFDLNSGKINYMYFTCHGSASFCWKCTLLYWTYNCA